MKKTMVTFVPIGMEKQAAYLNLLRKSGIESSDYSFINLWGWAEEYGLVWAWQDELVWIRQTRPEPVFWAPVGLWGKIEWQRVLEGMQDLPLQFTRIPERLIELWNASVHKGMDVREAREHWDYLYAANDLIELKGNRYHKKKNLLNQFMKRYAYEFVPITGDIIRQTEEMQRKWCHWRDCESMETLSAENRVIKRVLAGWNALKNITGAAILVGREIIAFTVAEEFDSRILIIHFEKGFTDYTGVYQAINQMFLSSKKGFTTVNRQQDFNDEGLRKAKLSYQPIDFTRKFHVTFF